MSPILRLLRAPSTTLALFAIALASPALAQAPARARVGLCVIEAPAGSQPLVESLAGGAAGLMSAVEQDLAASPSRSFLVVLVPQRAVWTRGTPPLDSTLNRIDAEVPPWAAGYTLPAQRLIVIRVAEAARYPYGTLESVFAHELSHLIVHDATGGQLPRWLDEGLATWQGRRWSLVDAFALSASMMLRPLPALAAADTLFVGDEAGARLAYAQAFTFTAWSVHRYGERFPSRLVRELAAHSLEVAWERAASEPLAVAERDWRRSAAVRFRWLPWVGTSGVLWALTSLLAALASARRRRLALAQRAQLPDLPWHPDDPLAPPEAREGAEVVGPDDPEGARPD